MVKNPPAMQETWVQYLDWEDPLEKEMATHSRILAWKIPWIEEPGRLQPTGLQRVGYHRAWQPTPEFLPGKSHEQRSLVGYSPWGHKESIMAKHIQHIHRSKFWYEKGKDFNHRTASISIIGLEDFTIFLVT